jgi:hypothetical protein
MGKGKASSRFSIFYSWKESVTKCVGNRKSLAISDANGSSELTRDISAILSTRILLERNAESDVVAKRERSIFITSTSSLLNSEYNEFRVRTSLSAQIERNEGAI